MHTRYNLAYREEEREMLPCCLDQGVGVIPYTRWRGPVAGTRDGDRRTATAVSEGAGRATENDFEVLDALRKVAAEQGPPPAWGERAGGEGDQSRAPRRRSRHNGPGPVGVRSGRTGGGLPAARHVRLLLDLRWR